MRVVAADSSLVTGQLLQYVLSQPGHDVVLVQTAADAMAAVFARPVEAVVLHEELADLPGSQLCQEIRGRRFTGAVVILSPRRDVRHKLLAFDRGADDVVVEPYDPLELLARIEAAARRCARLTSCAADTVLKVADVELSIGELTVRVGNRRPLALTPTEMRVLEFLMRNAGIIVTRGRLIERTWGYDYVGDGNRVDVCVSRVRRKLESLTDSVRYLHTIRGVGYVFRPVVVLPAGVRTRRAVPAAAAREAYAAV